MLLAIDVGNTNVTIGVFDGDRLAHSWRLAALRERTADELGIYFTNLFQQVHLPVSAVTGIAIAWWRAACRSPDGGPGIAPAKRSSASRISHARVVLFES